MSLTFSGGGTERLYPLAESVEAWLKTVEPQKIGRMAEKFNVSVSTMRETVKLLIDSRRAHSITTGSAKKITFGPALHDAPPAPKPFKPLQYGRAMLAALERCEEKNRYPSRHT